MEDRIKPLSIKHLPGWTVGCGRNWFSRFCVDETTCTGHLGQCVPTFLHLDEGTSLRKSAIMIYSFEAVFGQQTAQVFEELLASSHDKSPNGVMKLMTKAQCHNARGSTYQSRFLFTAIPKRWYKGKLERVYHTMLDVMSRECAGLFTDGVQVHGRVFYMVCLGLKADQPAQVKAAKLTRSFMNLGEDIPCCYECLAGRRQYPFEEISRRPAWLQTLHAEVPWKHNDQSPLLQIPHLPFQSATFFRRDPFHIWKQTLGGHWIASAVVLLMDLKYYNLAGQGNSVQTLFERASFDFDFWVRFEWRQRVRPNMKKFTKELFHFARSTSYPYGRFKGQDMMLLCRWIHHILLNGVIFEGQLLRSGKPLREEATEEWHQRAFELLRFGCDHALTFFHIMHKQGIWLEPTVANRMAEAAYQFCKCYGEVALLCHQKALCRFHLVPSLHYFLHFYFDLHGKSFPAVSPALSNNEANEDFVGRVSRLSRCVHAATTTLRVIQRYLIKCHFEFEEEELIRDPK